VECQSLEEGIEAAGAGADIVMLDNFSSATIHDTARQIKAKFPHILIEASGVRCFVFLRLSVDRGFRELKKIIWQSICQNILISLAADN
jgi:hypothetical protein